MRKNNVFSQDVFSREQGTKMPVRALRGVLLLIVIMAIGACGAETESVAGAEGASQVHSVRPRVVLDGLIELSSRTEGRVFVDEVVIHAPTVRMQSGVSDETDHVSGDLNSVSDGLNRDGLVTDILATDSRDESPLLFRYSTAASAGGMRASSDDRTWDLSAAAKTPGATLVFGFGPLEADQEALEALEARLGYEVSALAGYTAIISGFVETKAIAPGEPKNSLNRSEDRNPTTYTASGDPDGAPATGDPDGKTASGDPDGAPASGDPDGAPASGDPDGAPASGGPDGAPASGDPDGAPADEDEDEDESDEDNDQNGVSTDVDVVDVDDAPPAENALASGDPDGAPANVGGMNAGASAMEEGSLGPQRAEHNQQRNLVPFVIVFATRFELSIPTRSLLKSNGLATRGTPSTLPIDLHVDADSLFNQRVLDLLSASAEATTGGNPALLILSDEADSFRVETESVYEIPNPDQPGLLVTGDRRQQSEDDR